MLESVCKAFPAKVRVPTVEELEEERERQLEYQKRAHAIRQAAALAKIEEANRLVRFLARHSDRMLKLKLLCFKGFKLCSI